jgi:ribonuclease HIII
MKIRKIIYGFVVQQYEDGKPVSQEFVENNMWEHERVYSNGMTKLIGDDEVPALDFFPITLTQPGVNNDNG